MFKIYFLDWTEITSCICAEWNDALTCMGFKRWWLGRHEGECQWKVYGNKVFYSLLCIFMEIKVISPLGF